MNSPLALLGSLALAALIVTGGLLASDSATSARTLSSETSGSPQWAAVIDGNIASQRSAIPGKKIAQNACWNSGQFCDAAKVCCEGLVCDDSRGVGRCTTP